MTKNYEYLYYISDLGEEDEDACSFSSNWPTTYSNYIAEDAAQVAWDDHEGWDWIPTDGINELVILTTNKKEIGRFKVSFESVPSFSATKIEKKEKEGSDG